MYQLYGDGIYDDIQDIQVLLDSGTSLVSLPAPAAHYCISQTLCVLSGQTAVSIGGSLPK